MNDTHDTQTPVIVDPYGKPARTSATDACPRCGQGLEVRRASGGFGVPWTVCACGHEWKDRPFRG